MTHFNRREMLILAGGAAAGLTGCVQENHSVDSAKSHSGSRRVLRAAHFTDIHVQPEQRAPEGFAAALEHMQQGEDAPQLLLVGGDSVMDSFQAQEPRVREQWEVYKKVMAEHCRISVRACIGNHDVWGWDKESSLTTGAEPLWGKAWAIQSLGIDKRYYSFNQAGWHFVMLDSTFQPPENPRVYTARLDEEQFAWLENDLQAHGQMPTALVSHIPILSAAAFMDGENEKDGDWHVPGAWMHLDARRLKDLFLKHPQVKLCLSGHLHLVDHVVYNDVHYICDGAVCAGWWKGDYQECDEGYGVVDFYADGSFAHRYVSYHWVAEPEPVQPVAQRPSRGIRGGHERV
ncbi:MAG: metallophosphoesterase [Sedimentisphaerales bacterium]|nr:metallophosphoesterase [Sedimentisphaerales bacterium]